MFKTKTAEAGQASNITTNFHAGRKYNGDLSQYLSFNRDIENVSNKHSMTIGPRLTLAFYRPITWTEDKEADRAATINLVENFVVPLNATTAAMNFAQFTFTVTNSRLALKNKEKERIKEEEELERQIGLDVFEYLKTCTDKDIHTEVMKADSQSQHPGVKSNIALRSIRNMVLPPGSAATLQLEIVQELNRVPYANTFSELQTLMHQVHVLWTKSKETSTEMNKYYTGAILHIRNEIEAIQAIIADPQVPDNEKIRPGIDLVMFQTKLQEIQSDHNKDNCPMLAGATIYLTLQSRIPSTGDLQNIHNAIRKIRNSADPQFTVLQNEINMITSEQRELDTVRKNAPLRDDDNNTPPRQGQAQIKYDEYPPDKDHTNCNSSCLLHLAYSKGCKRSRELCLKTHYRHDTCTMPSLRDTAHEMIDLERLRQQESSKDQEPNRRRSNSLNSNGSNESNYSRNGTKRPDKRSRQDRAPTPYQQQQQTRGGSILHDYFQHYMTPPTTVVSTPYPTAVLVSIASHHKRSKDSISQLSHIQNLSKSLASMQTPLLLSHILSKVKV